MRKFHGDTIFLKSTRRKFTIRNSTWNFRSLLIRFLVVSILILFFLWIFVQFNILIFSKLNEAIFSQTWLNNPASGKASELCNFTITFSNLKKQYTMPKPPIEPCDGKKIKLLILIMSRRESEEKRHGIRNSWGRDAPKGVIIRFVIGSHTPSEQNHTVTDMALENEQRKFADLIRYDIADGYENLHFKMSAAFQWQQAFCPNAEFVMKTDDDTIVDLPRWEFWTETTFRKDLERNKATFFGCVLANTSPIRQLGHKWYVPVEHFPGDIYPDYMQGATYFGTNEAIRAVMAHTSEVIGFNMDDIVFTGTLAVIANVSRLDYKTKHFRGGNTLLPDEPCDHGVPLIFTFFRSYTKAAEYIQDYQKLHSLKCGK